MCLHARTDVASKAMGQGKAPSLGRPRQVGGARVQEAKPRKAEEMHAYELAEVSMDI